MESGSLEPSHVALALLRLAIRRFEAQRSIETPWLDGATTRVPKLFPVADMPTTAPLQTPEREDWHKEAAAMASAAA